MELNDDSSSSDSFVDDVDNDIIVDHNCINNDFTGKIFENLEKAEEFVYNYGLCYGFTIRKDNMKKRRGSDEIIWRKYRCSKFNSAHAKNTTKEVSCPVYIDVKVIGNGNAVISKAVLKHCHSIVLPNKVKDNYKSFKILTKRIGKLIANNDVIYNNVCDLLLETERIILSGGNTDSSESVINQSPSNNIYSNSLTNGTASITDVVYNIVPVNISSNKDKVIGDINNEDYKKQVNKR
mmetsp:Transcript_383/g.333  ORF Transcript_383/g.333 Transcript_383/m.333 type:complete len:237 (-) Transcript_383:13-723(-)